jgi:acyl transferase domain-containing protein/NAD(P)-dependent dehydrogenase (short-subunit alcohol dehydrogenase family)
MGVIDDDNADIAIVGLACRFPGARDADEFWRNLAGGVESIVTLSDDEILASGVSQAQMSLPDYVKAAAVLDEPGGFDAAFFGFTPNEARTMDPQHRILLELAYVALEDAGCDPARYPGRAGVFTGSAMNTYFMHAGLNRNFAEDYIPTLIVNDKDFLSTRISYKLNLKGPSLTVQTACSTSLVAVHLARQSLLSEEIDLALAGAISVRAPHRAGYRTDAGGVASPDGHVRAFDAGANGTLFGSGGGVVALKRLRDALADGDTIRAIIKGSAVNNDGAEKAGYTAPSVNSQADAIVEALANADVDADSISYIEAHGSGTPVGDPIEVRALTKAFRSSTQRSGFCAIGSVKTNVGHLDAAAGMAGLIKTVLALQHRQIPASLNYSQPNPEIDFSTTPFFVNTQLTPWSNAAGARRAGIMSTGMGGTNAHVVLEEAPPTAAHRTSSQPRLFVLSARTEAALAASADRLRAFLDANPATNLDAAAFTLQTGRRAMPHRRFVVAADSSEIIAHLAAKPKRMSAGVVREGSEHPLVLLLPGVGDHYVGMGRDLYAAYPAFRREVDRCAEILHPYLGLDIRDVLYPKRRDWQKSAADRGLDLKKMLAGNTQPPEDDDSRRLNQSAVLQPALFTVEYALTRLWSDLGVVPQAIVGHSMGEYVAACLAGVFSLEDALRLIVRRTQLVEQLPPGHMLAVTLPETELQSLLPGDLSISLINGPSLCVVAGPPAAVEEFSRTLTARGVIFRAVQNTHAFHSRLMDPVVGAFEAEVRKVQLSRPQLPFVSNVTGRWISDADATDPAYWARHLNHTARFNDALHTVWQMDAPLLLEAGPGKTLGVLANQHPDKQSTEAPLAISSLRHHYESQPDAEVFLHAVGRLWLCGVKIGWEKLPAQNPRRKIPLPTYPFERQNFWLSPAPPVAEVRSIEPNPGPLEFNRWFHVPSWERTASVEASPANLSGIHWIIFSDRQGNDHGFREALTQSSATVEFVRFGKAWENRGDGSTEIDPRRFEDYLHVFRKIKDARCTGIHIVHLGCLGGDPMDHDRAQDFGFFSLLQIAQAVGELNIVTPVKIAVVSSGLHQVIGDEELYPAMAPVLGACGVIPKEFPNVVCWNIDLAGASTAGTLSDAYRCWTVSEFTRAEAGEILAYRGAYRWKRKFVPVNLPPAIQVADHSNAPGVDRLRERGVYLITGGTGGICLAVARHLARTCRARLVLTRKSPFPDKAQWNDLLQLSDTPPTTARILRQLVEIESLGGEVEVMVAEASDRQAMANVLTATRAKFGAVHGVIHAAGIVQAGIVQAKTRSSAESVLAPKVAGTWVLHDLLAETDLDFMVLFSSITAMTTPFAESDYCGANAFLDAFAHFSRTQRPYPVISINWPGWKEAGQLVDLKSAPGTEHWKEAALQKAILTEQGLEAFQRALAANLPQVVVSPTNLESEIRESGPPADNWLSKGGPQKILPSASVQPPGTPQSPLRADQLQDCVVAVWQQILGFDQIDPNDSFFDLGGHSLLLIQVHRELCRRLDRQISLLALFQNPTPKALAHHLSAGAPASPGVDKARLRAERQRQALAARNPSRT